MVKTEITTKDGTKIIIEGSEEEVKRVISHIHQKSPTKQESSRKTTSKKEKPVDKMSIAHQISELNEVGFFKTPRTLSEIKDALAKNGMIYPITSLSGKVIEKVRKRELGRI